jgi:hypothetical protein
VATILKMATGRNFSMSGIISGHHYYYYYSLSPFYLWHMNLSTADLWKYWTQFHETWWSYRYMFVVGPKLFNFVVKGVKVTLSGIISGHHYLPTYQIVMISDNVEFLRYCGDHFENGDR